MTESPNAPRGAAPGFAAGVVPVWRVGGWLMGRDPRRRRHRWAVARQLREMEQVIDEESLPDWQREVIQEVCQRQAEVKCEARCRLGLPEEGP